jgi:hypothetical protein
LNIFISISHVCWRLVNIVDFFHDVVNTNCRSFGDLLLLSYARNAKTQVPLYVLTDDVEYYQSVLRNDECKRRRCFFFVIVVGVETQLGAV